jgi:hypothetical protein
MAALGFVLVTSPAFGQRPGPTKVQLEYTRGNLNTCPQESFFHHYVASHFGGEDPFSATAKGKITLSLSRKGRGFGATLAMYDEAGARLGGEELRADECFGLVENAGLLVVTWLMPIVGPDPAPSPSREPAKQAEPVPAPPAPAPPAPSTAPDPPAPSKPIVREQARSPALPVAIAAYSAAGTFLALGIAWTVDAQRKEDHARTLASMLSSVGGADACSPAMAASPGGCAQLVSAFQARDTSIGFRNTWYTLAGISAGLGVSATIWAVSRRAKEGRPRTQVAIRPGGIAIEGTF